MGLDYYYDHSPREHQQVVLTMQLRYALARGMPVVFPSARRLRRLRYHLASRGARAACAGSFTASRTARSKRATLVRDFGLYLGIGGVLTFKSAQSVRDAVALVGLDHLILETDCPYLAPVPHRGQRNEPAFIAATAAALADTLGTTVEDVVARTSHNAAALFG
jgi:TatD DNase family protein